MAAMIREGGRGVYLTCGVGGLPGGRVRRGEPVMFDALGQFNHYHGDFGRCAVVGEAASEHRRRHAAIQSGWEAALEVLRPGRRYSEIAAHVGAAAKGRCSFEALVDEHCAADPALVELARIIHGADLEDLDAAPECRGLLTISRGFPLVARDDQETMEKAAFLYDALYASLKQRWGGNADYDAWFDQPLNNATIAAVATYRRWVPVMRMRLEALGLAGFYAEMAELAKLKVPERAARLEAMENSFSTATGPLPQPG